MADQKITELTNEATPTSDDLVAIVNSPGGTPATRKATLASLAAAVVGVAPSAYIQTLLDDADAATARGTLGIVGSGDPLDTESNVLSSADIDIPTAGTFVDGPSVSLSAGTWLVVGKVKVAGSATNQFIRATAKLWDGSTVWASCEAICPAMSGTTGEVELPVSAIISLGGTTTVKISATGSTNGQDLKIDNLQNAAGSVSYIHAVRIG